MKSAPLQSHDNCANCICWTEYCVIPLTAPLELLKGYCCLNCQELSTSSLLILFERLELVRIGTQFSHSSSLSGNTFVRVLHKNFPLCFCIISAPGYCELLGHSRCNNPWKLIQQSSNRGIVKIAAPLPLLLLPSPLARLFAFRWVMMLFGRTALITLLR